MASKRLKKIVRTVHKYEGRVLKVAAPVVGAVFGGVVGAAAGTAVGSFASYYGEKQGALAKGRHGSQVKKAGRRGLKSGLMIGGIVTGGAVALGAASALSGGSFLASGVSSVGTIFGGAAPKGPVSSGPFTTQADLARELQTNDGGGVPGMVTSLEGGQGAGGVNGMITSRGLASERVNGGPGFGQQVALKGIETFSDVLGKRMSRGDTYNMGEKGLGDSIKKLLNVKNEDGSLSAGKLAVLGGLGVLGLVAISKAG